MKISESIIFLKLMLLVDFFFLAYGNLTDFALFFVILQKLMNSG